MSKKSSQIFSHTNLNQRKEKEKKIIMYLSQLKSFIPFYPHFLKRLLIQRNPTRVVQMFPGLPGDIGSVVPRIHLAAWRVADQFVDQPLPLHLCPLRRVDLLEPFLTEIAQDVGDPVTLDFDAGRTVREGSGCLGTIGAGK